MIYTYIHNSVTFHSPCGTISNCRQRRQSQPCTILDFYTLAFGVLVQKTTMRHSPLQVLVTRDQTRFARKMQAASCIS